MSSERKLPTHAEMTDLFWLVFGSLDSRVQEITRGWWKTIREAGPEVVTDPQHFTAEVYYTLIVGPRVMFRVDRIADRKHSVIRLIYHELSHCYLAAAGRHNFEEYFARRAQYESGAIKMTKRLVEDLSSNAAQKSLLRTHPLILRLNEVFDFAPLYLEGREKRLVMYR